MTDLDSYRAQNPYVKLTPGAVDLTDVARRLKLDYVPPLVLRRNHTYSGSTAEFNYHIPSRRDRVAGARVRQGEIIALDPTLNLLDWIELEADLKYDGRVPDDLSRLDIVRWTLAHEAAHAWQLQSDPYHPEEATRQYAAMNMGLFDHGALPIEQEADQVASAGLWKHVIINGHKARGAGR